MSPKLFARIAAAAVIGLTVGLLIATTESIGYGMLFTDFIRLVAIPLLWPARLLIPAASINAAMAAIAANALLYAAAAALADRLYTQRD